MMMSKSSFLVALLLICYSRTTSPSNLRLSTPPSANVTELNSDHKKWVFDGAGLVGGPRVRRQAAVDPQPFSPLIANRVLNVPIPTNIGFFPGVSAPPVDRCERDSVQMMDGSCQRLLTRGNCSPRHQVILDPVTNIGYCVPRICPPARVFVAATQLCHSPQDTTVCPPGRELFYSAFGTGICSCPDGSVERANSLYADVCEPLLQHSYQCPRQQVFWYRDFGSRAECLPDPCSGANVNRDSNTLPFLPSVTQNCFQLGQSEGICQPGEYNALSLKRLRGECKTLEEAGYNIFDLNELRVLEDIFGRIVSENFAPPIRKSVKNQFELLQNNIIKDFQTETTLTGNVYKANSVSSNYIQGKIRQAYSKNRHGVNLKNNTSPNIIPGLVNNIDRGTPEAYNTSKILNQKFNEITSFDTYGYRLGRSLGFQDNLQHGILMNHYTITATGHKIQHRISRNKRSFSYLKQEKKSELQHSLLFEEAPISKEVQTREKRALLPHASPSNAFETRLLSCKSGAARDINGKCREIVLPSRIPNRRETRAAPPVPPTPTCPRGMVYGLRNMCNEATTAQNGLIVRGLG